MIHLALCQRVLAEASMTKSSLAEPLMVGDDIVGHSLNDVEKHQQDPHISHHRPYNNRNTQ